MRGRNRIHSRLKNPSLGFSEFVVSLFSAGEKGVWYDPSDLTTLFQDSAGTVPVTAADQPVGLMRDKSGNAIHATQVTAASRPILRNAGSRWWLDFDGVDDFLVTGSIDLTVTANVSLFCAVTNESAVRGMIAEFSATLANPGTFQLDVAAPTNRTYGWGISAVAPTGRFIVGDPSIVTTDVIQCGYNIAVAGLVNQVVPRINGAPATVSNGVEDGTLAAFINAPLYIGRRGGTTLPFNGLMYGLIVRGRSSTATEISGAEKYLSLKSGVSV